VRNRLIGRLAVATAATVALSAAVVSTQAPAPPAGQASPAAPGAGRGRGAAAEPPEATPRLADGTVNLGRVPGEKGIWNVPYITNMGMRLIGEDGKPLAPQAAPGGRRGGAAAGAPLGGGEGTAGGGRGGAKAEPWVPFQPWAAAVYDYNSKN